ncbi:hypothetical protein DL89DRAFT_247415 [Linderina pennispora]|uniref:Multicopper oxidase n=1 Tax=Linderina pennispora TaxID=61395 RepID=A0A1Y1W5G1_9FUNG|nr:uncharacterized protein DL89DRAFT_247415 [Linderina pennispora]ORX68466.1 hypothetical protein DL89DRAFT_247415 [Linderina pennispora]
MFLSYFLTTAALSIGALGAQVTHDWTISEIPVNLDGKHPRTAIGVNGQMTVPVVRAQLGDTLVLRVHNKLDEPTGLHSHGIFNNGTNYYDGAGGITECGVAPKSTFDYRIPLVQTGTYWLHGHHGSQYMNGLRGPLIITDPNGEPYDYDEDIVVAMEDFFPQTSHMTMAGEPDMHKMNSTGMGMGMADRQTNQLPLRDKIKHQNLRFTPGRTYRIRLLNIGSTMMFRFGIEGHDLHIIEVDGLATKPRTVSSVEVAVAQRVSVLVTAKPQASHNYRYHIEQFSDIFPEVSGFNPNHQEGLVLYSRNAPTRRCRDITWEHFEDMKLTPLDMLPLMTPDVRHDITLTANRVDNEITGMFINNISFALPAVPSMFTALAARGQMTTKTFPRNSNVHVLGHLHVLELRIFNHDIVRHPMHMHGHFFQIVEQGVIGKPETAVRSGRYPMRRDTAVVPPGHYMTMRFRADNPGVWMFHCHIDKHAASGLTMLFACAPEVMNERIKVPNSVVDHCHMMGIDV